MTAPFTVALTRPEPQATSTAQKLLRAGYGVLKAPLLHATPLPGWGEADGIGALALTSRTAAMLLAEHPAFHAIPTFCVGEATADDARKSGAGTVTVAGGDVDALFAVLCAQATPPIVHLCGEDHRGALAERLQAAGIHAERRIVYKMVAATRLPTPNTPPDAALLYSPRTAKIYAGLATAPPWRDVACVALSPAVAAPLAASAVVAATPDETALLGALESVRAAAPA
ncbi:MAG: uroporphyrinogen-III synthase [Pseudomonadota bacterium]